MLSRFIKRSLTHIGGIIPAKLIYQFDAALNYLEVGRWMNANGYQAQCRVERREQLFDMVADEVGERDALYMEFGVYSGDSMRYWSHLLRNPRSKLHGFDSFEGLPENWLPQRPKGHFSLQGQIPHIRDPRVRFFSGWFDQTLPRYRFPAHDVLILNFDADLYASTICVLHALEREIVPGTYIYFDEFNHRFHELRAFREFKEKTHSSYRLLGATPCLDHVVFQRIG